MEQWHTRKKRGTWFSDIQLTVKHNPITAGNDLYQKNTSTTKYNAFNLFSTYKKTIGKNDFSVMLGFNQESNNYTYFNASVRGQAVPTVPSFAGGTGTKVITDGTTQYTIRSGFGRLTYNYDNRYLLTFNGRYDGSSKFPKSNRFGFFPSFSAGWRISQKKFMDWSNSWLGELKLRNRAGVGEMVVAEIDANFDPERDKGTDAWIKNYDAKTTYEVDPVLWEIRRERMVELMGQGFAFYDIKRWHKAPYYVNRQACGAWVTATDLPYGTGKYTGSFVDYNEIKRTGYGNPLLGATEGWIYTKAGALSSGKGWLDAYYLSMIPTDQIVLNPALEQNPGYEALFGAVGSK